ncbi:Major facilitator superfamily transporter [Cordyceps militaris]|uniref:Major facilitator superfamily transporter n=1 Tax=Cordyceps militaris TaxID=73501 RepID=A0A2H4SHH2_CORMI|nr:Major facilitator superfamily transporter [Cordyceps militaris]
MHRRRKLQTSSHKIVKSKAVLAESYDLIAASDVTLQGAELRKWSTSEWLPADHFRPPQFGDLITPLGRDPSLTPLPSLAELFLFRPSFEQLVLPNTGFYDPASTMADKHETTTPTDASSANDPDPAAAAAIYEPAAAESKEAEAIAAPPPAARKSWRFWAVFGSLCLATWLVAVESTVVSTALPVITREISAGDSYIWILNVYLLTSCTFIPLTGQAADLWGRRNAMLGAISLFALGSGLAGGASNLAMLIAGRAVQGIGGGGISFLLQVIVCDLVALRERGTYMGYVLLFFMVGTATGPVIGGAIVQRTSWRWIFYINLPVAGLTLVLNFLFLKLKYKDEGSFRDKLKRIDWAGNILLTLAVVSVLIALSWGGARYPWSSYQVLVPFLLGILGLVVFHLYEMMPWVKAPILPERLFKRRTPAAALLIAFLQFFTMYYSILGLPIYFQGVKGQTPLQSGVSFLPISTLSVFVGIVAGVIMSKTGRFKMLHVAAFVLKAVGMGLFSHFNRDTSRAEYICIELIFAIGIGCLATSGLPGVQADLTDEDTALSTAAYDFMRAYGAIWGVSVPAAVFNSRSRSLAAQVSDPDVRAILGRGGAYEFVTFSNPHDRKFSDQVLEQITGVFSDSMRTAWYVGLAFCLLGFLLAWCEKNLKLRETLETEFGLEEEKKIGPGDVENGKAEATSDAS